jgi:TetR/AcrR family transcriptional repressor of mexJK operon
MTTAATGKNLREGSPQKRESILAAARELFLTDGFDRTSMDAVAARAGVSKRTVYDYYGDKRTLLFAVVEKAIKALGAAVHRAVDDNLFEIDDLESALIGAATSVTTTTLGSADYTALTRLLANESSNLPDLARLVRQEWMVTEPEALIAERFAEFDRLGLLSAPDPRLAADHFVALTVKPLQRSREGRDDAEARQSIIDGVKAFLRAYGAAPL